MTPTRTACFIALLFSALLFSCSGEPLEAPEEELRKLFGAEQCVISPQTQILQGETLTIVNVELINVTGTFGKLEPWQINGAVGLAFYQRIDKSLLAEYDGIAGEITATKTGLLSHQTTSEFTALTVEGFAHMDSIQSEMQSILKSRLEHGDFMASRHRFDTTITDDNLVDVDMRLDAASRVTGPAIDSLLIGFRYVGFVGHPDQFMEVQLVEEFAAGWIAYIFVFNKRTGKVVTFYYKSFGF